MVHNKKCYIQHFQLKELMEIEKLDQLEQLVDYSSKHNLSSWMVTDDEVPRYVGQSTEVYKPVELLK